MKSYSSRLENVAKKVSEKDLRLINETTELFINWKSLWQEKLQEADDLRKFVLDANEQWTQAEKTAFRNRGKAFIAVNICLRLLMNLMGMYSSNKREIRAVTETDNTAMADIHTKLLKYVTEQQNDFDTTFERMFSDGNMMRCGGWARLYWGMKDNEPQIIFENKESTSIINDPMATLYDNTDSRGIFESEFYSVEKIMEMVPEHAEEIWKRHQQNTKNESWVESILHGSLDAVRSLRSEGFDRDFQNRQSGMYRLVIFNYPKTIEDKYLFDKKEGKAVKYRPSGQKGAKVANKALDLLLQKDPKRYELERKRTKVFCLRVIIPALLYVIQDKELSVRTKNFQYFRYAPYHMARSLIDEVSVFTNLKPIQREKNKFRSLIADYIDKYIHPRTWIKKGSLTQDQLEALRKGDDNITYTGDTPPKMEQIHGITNELLVHDEVTNRDFEDLSGVTKSVQGVTQSEDNASLYQAKLAQSSQGLQPLLKNLARTRMAVANATHEMIKHYMTAPMQINIQSEDQIEGENLILNMPVGDQVYNDVSQGFFKIKLIDGPYSQTAKERHLAQAMMIIERMPPEAIPWPYLFDLLDLGIHTEKWKQWVLNIYQQTQQGAQAQAEREQMEAQLDKMIESRKLDNDEKSSKRDFNLKVMELIQKKNQESKAS